ncbi:MAG: hypothetical protein ACYS6W_01640 [Planctomycetota bacterium]|jgi:hypothetical protein
MATADAIVARGMATRHRRSVKAVVQGIGHINALLRRVIKGNRIKWDGYGKAFDWWVRKLDETAEWNSGELGNRTFEEKDPIDEASLDYCFLDRTYGVSEASIKTNRAAGAMKIYDIQKENARVAQSAMYRAITAALYSRSDGSKANGPAGLRTICGDPYESSSLIALAANKTYAGIANTGTAAIAAYAAKKASFTNKYWAPECIGIHEMPHPVSAGDKWSGDCLEALEFMTVAMGRTKDVSGTGKIVRPDLALMDVDPFNAIWAKHITYKGAGGPINLSDNDFDQCGIRNIQVGSITAVYDENVPHDGDAGGSSYEIVFVVDSKAFVIETCNTKSEGLIEGQWKGNTDPEIVGGVGVYKSNLGFRIDSPVCAGAIVGCND